MSTLPPQTSRLVVPATLCHQTLSLPLQALIDSGAEDNFIDHQLATQFWFPLGPLETPLSAKALSGKFLASVTHQTPPVTLILSGNHSEKIQLCVFSSPNTPLVLGHLWLKQHNPHIDWSVGKIVAWSTYCLSSCLQSALSPASDSTLRDTARPPDLSSIPAVYHDLREVFSKDLAVSLPQHKTIRLCH